MEVMDDPGYPGKMLVLFNGTQISCLNGTQCQGAALCAVNQTWMANQTSGMCMCNTKFGLTGYYCDEWCSHGTTILVMNVVAGAIAVVLSVISIYLLICLMIRFSNRRTWHRCNPVKITLILTSLGSLCFIVATILGTFNSLKFPSLYIMVWDGNLYDKRVPQTWESANSIMYGLAYCITVCSFIVLPLTWVAQSSLRMRKTQTTAIIVVTFLIVVLTVVIELPFYILVTSSYRATAARWVLGVVIGWVIIFPFIMFLNAFAFYRVTRIKCTAMASEAENAPSGLGRLLTRIQMSAAQIFVASLGALVTVAFFRPRSLRTFYSNPYCDFDADDFVFRFSMYFIEYGCAVAVWFVAPSATGRKAATVRTNSRVSRQPPVAPQLLSSIREEGSPKATSRRDLGERGRAGSLPLSELDKPKSPVDALASNLETALCASANRKGEPIDREKSKGLDEIVHT